MTTSAPVVVIGGGFGGLTTCTSIRKKDASISIILVEPKDYFEVPWTAYRTPFDAELADKAIFDLGLYCTSKNIEHKKTTVSTLTATTVTLASGESIDFSVCVVATGASMQWDALGRGPPVSEERASMEGRKAFLLQEGESLLKAKSIVIAGGGLIGAETAGELAFRAKEKGLPLKVTLVHSQEHLIPEYTPKAAAMAQKKLEALGVTVILKEKVAEENGKAILQKSKKEIPADRILFTTGVKPLTDFCQDKAWLDKHGFVMVDDYFRVKGTQKVFAIGDCCDLLPNAGNQVMGNIGIIGRNVLAAANGEPEKKMKKALASPEMYLITIGKKTGVAQTPMFHTQMMLPGFKNKTQFIFKVKSDLQVK